MTERERAAFLLTIDLVLASDGYTSGEHREWLRAKLREARAELGKPRGFIAEATAILTGRNNDAVR